MLCLLISQHLLAGMDLGKEFIRQNLLIQRYDIDPSADAVVLYEKITTVIDYKTFNQTKNVRRIIRVLKNAAQNSGTVKIFFRRNYNSYISDLKGTTYSLDNGALMEKAIGKSDYYTRRTNNDFSEMGFNMPDVKEGCIIDYSYEQHGSVSLMLPTWDIQEEYPKLYSEYEITYPTALQYTSVSHLQTPFKEYNSVKKAEKDSAVAFVIYSKQTYEGELYGNVVWTVRNIPAIKEEPYIIDVENYRQRLELQLTGIIEPMHRQQFFNNWKKVNDDLWLEQYFGKQLKASNNFLNDVTDSMKKINPSKEAIVKNIFSYVRANFTCNDHESILATQSMNKTFENRGGSSTDINLLLIAMLNNADIEAWPLILSTRGNTPASKFFPLINRFNYTVCYARLDSNNILLDASDEYNPVNTLPLYCYNGYARVIDKGAGSDLILDNNSVTDRIVSMTQMTFGDNGTADVSVSLKLGKFSSRSFRQKATKDKNAPKEYVKEQLGKMPEGFGLKDCKVENMEDADTPVVIKFSYSVSNTSAANALYVNATPIKFVEKNPFTAIKRTLPVEFPYKKEWLSVVIITPPHGFVADELPKPVVISYNDKDISYRKLYSEDTQTHAVTITTRVHQEQANYTVESYPTIQQFFEKLLRDQNAMVAFKKI